jgi:site-specific recombinase XerD
VPAVYVGVFDLKQFAFSGAWHRTSPHSGLTVEMLRQSRVDPLASVASCLRSSVPVASPWTAVPQLAVCNHPQVLGLAAVADVHEVASECIRRQFRCLSALCSYAFKNGWIPKTPCIGINLPECVAAERYQLTPEDTLNLAAAVGGYNSIAVWTLAETRCRWGEVFGLRISNIDLDRKIIKIEQGLTRDEKGAPVLGKKGSRKARPRELAITDWLADLLRDHINSLKVQTPNGWIFPDGQGGPIRYSNWRRRIWLPALDKAGLKDLVPLPGPHDLRRVNATQLAASGVDLRTLMNRMGHKTAKLALEVYSQADPIADRAAADTIGLHVLNAMSHLKRTESSGSESPSRTQ